MKVTELNPRGTLIRFINVLYAEIRHDNFTNIGAFTLEHLQKVISIVKKETTTIKNKGLLKLTNINPN